MPNDDYRYRESRRNDDYDNRPLRRISPRGFYRPTEDECTNGMLCHLLGIFMHFLGPIIIWMMKKEESRFVDYHGREALNFSINMVVYGLIAVAILTVIAVITCGIGAMLFPLVLIINVYALVMHIIALNATKNGEWYRYPGIFRLIPPPEGMEDFEPQARYDEGEREIAGGYEDAPRERKSMWWVWALCGTAALLLGGCCIGGIVFAVIEDRRSTQRASIEELEPVEIGKGDNLPVVRDPPPRNQPPVGADKGRPGDNAPPNRPNLPNPADPPGDPIDKAIGRLKTGNQPEKRAAAEMLGKSGDKRASKALAEALKDIVAQRAAIDALKAFGSSAEDDVIPILREPQFASKKAAFEVLGAIGTKKSFDVIEPMTKDRNRLVSGAARDASNAIWDRLKK